MSTPRTKRAAAGAIVALAVVGTAGLVPSVAAAATGEGSAVSRVDRITEALAGLVTDGTLTQEQADEVATTVDEALPPRGHRPGRHGGGGGLHLDTAAEALGVTTDELLAELRAGQTLGQVADERDVSRDALVDALVTEAEERLAQAVADGRLTQEQADARKAELPARIASQLDRTGPGGGRFGPKPGTEPAPGADAGPELEGSSLAT